MCDVVLLPRGSSFWQNKHPKSSTSQPVESWITGEPVLVYVTRRTGIKWNGTGLRPMNLTEGLVTIGHVPHIIMFQLPKE